MEISPVTLAQIFDKEVNPIYCEEELNVKTSVFTNAPLL